MKYIAVFDVPDGYAIGCATAKIAEKGRKKYSVDDIKYLIIGALIGNIISFLIIWWRPKS